MPLQTGLLKFLSPPGMHSSVSSRHVHVLLWIVVALFVAALIAVRENDRRTGSRFKDLFGFARLRQERAASEEAANRRQDDANRRLDNLAQLLPTTLQTSLSSEREITRFNERLAALSFSLGVKSNPADINLGTLDS
jgi:hypothetical protein